MNIVIEAIEHIKENMPELEKRVEAKETDLLFLKSLMEDPYLRSVVKVCLTSHSILGGRIGIFHKIKIKKLFLTIKYLILESDPCPSIFTFFCIQRSFWDKESIYALRCNVNMPQLYSFPSIKVLLKDILI